MINLSIWLKYVVFYSRVMPVMSDIDQHDSNDHSFSSEEDSPDVDSEHPGT